VTSGEKSLIQLLGFSVCFAFALARANAEKNCEGNEDDQSEKIGSKSEKISFVPSMPTNEEPSASKEATDIEIEKVPEVSVETLFSTPIPAKEDLYQGVMIDIKDLPSSVAEFQARMTVSLALWKSQDKRGVWLTIPADKSELIPIAVQLG
jgi:hypothetical protein